MVNIYTCNYCQKNFEREAKLINRRTIKNQKFYCSASCSHLAHRKRIKVPCYVCCFVVERAPSQISDKVFCSSSCSAIYNNTIRKRAIKPRSFSQRERRANIRKEVILSYGGKCVCCGEECEVFLNLDHKNNDGSLHRKELCGTNIYEWARKNNYPDRLQLLCCNCNQGKFRNNGVCPHETAVAICKLTQAI